LNNVEETASGAKVIDEVRSEGDIIGVITTVMGEVMAANRESLESLEPDMREFAGVKNPGREQQPRYLLTHKAAMFRVRGLVMCGVTLRHCEGSVRSALHQLEQECSRVGGDWVICAWEVTAKLIDDRRTVDTGAPQTSGGDHSDSVIENQGNTPRTRYVTAQSRELHLGLTYVDVSGAELTDTWGEDTGKTDGAWRAAADSQQLRHLPRAGKKNRGLAVDLLERYAAHQGLGQRTFAPEQVAMVRSALELNMTPAQIVLVSNIALDTVSQIMDHLSEQ